MFAATIFISAFLLFLVQPLIARIILPWFGGTAAVWTTCLMFFQTTLLLGYVYSFWSIRSRHPRRQAAVHLGLLAGSLCVLPILPAASWKPIGAGHPVPQILMLLAATVGLPYLVLSTTGPLLQAWYADANTGDVSYRLYALSNAASLLALVAYPTVVEPLTGASAQADGWSVLYIGFVLLCGSVALGVYKQQPRSSLIGADETSKLPGPPWREQALWIALAACPSALLLAVTNHLSQNIAPIPLLWVVPLGVYLLSLILCFDSDRWYQPRLWFPLLLAAAGTMTYFLFPVRGNEKVTLLVPVFVLGLFCCCMSCHGELARRKPEPSWLTSFYLMLSLGGALGGMFVALLSPLIFRMYVELPLTLLVGVSLVAVIQYRSGTLRFSALWPRLQIEAAVGVVFALIYLLGFANVKWASQQRLLVRNFYGALRVMDRITTTTKVRYLVHGTIDHGSQSLEKERRHQPISYYGPSSGIGLAIADRRLAGPIKFGIIGLGAGTLAAYGRPEDTVRFYEINPLIEQIARSQFTYLSECPSKLYVLLGDARRTLEAGPPQGFDVLALDAFSSDSIAVHLLTTEAFREYFRNLKPDGILAVHISKSLSESGVGRAAGSRGAGQIGVRSVRR